MNVNCFKHLADPLRKDILPRGAFFIYIYKSFNSVLSKSIFFFFLFPHKFHTPKIVVEDLNVCYCLCIYYVSQMRQPKLCETRVL